MRLRAAGVTNLGLWMNLHPLISARFGMVPIGILSQPEVVNQQATFAPGAASGWHTHPGYLTSTVVSGQVIRYGTDCSSQTFTAGQSFYETGASTFIVKNHEHNRSGRRERNLRRSRRHADDGAANRQGAALELHAVSRPVPTSVMPWRGERFSPPRVACLATALVTSRCWPG